MRLQARPSLFVVLVAASVLASTPPAIGADQEIPEQIGGLGYSEQFDHTKVRMDVFVRDQEGGPVIGLARDQFQLFQNGDEVAITNFAAFTQGSFAPQLPVPAASDSSQAADTNGSASSDEAQPIYIVLFIDNRHLYNGDRNQVLRALRTFVSGNLGDHVQIMVISYRRSIEVVQHFTDDRRAVGEALRVLRMSEADLDERSEDRQRIRREIRRGNRTMQRTSAGRERTLSDLYSKLHAFANEESVFLDGTLFALRDTATALAGVTGRKYLIYVSNGLPMVLIKDLLHEFAGLDKRTTQSTLATPYNRRRNYEMLASAANSQEITIHAIDATGLSNPTRQIGDTDTKLSTTAAVIMRDNLQDPLELLAEETGGLAVVRTDDFDAGLDRIRADLLTYYSIGYDIESGSSDTVHHIKINVNTESEYDTRYRPTFVERSMHSQVQDMVTTGLFFDVVENPLGIEVTPGEQEKATESQWMQPLSVSLPVTALAMTRDGDDYVGQVALFVAMRDLEGSESDVQRQIHDFRLPVDEYEQRKDDHFTILLRLLLASGEHDIVVGVLDEETHQTSYQKLQTTSPE